MFRVRGIGGRGHRQHVDPPAQLLDALLVGHAEPLLLVDDQQPEVAEPHVLREQPVGADDDVHPAGHEIGERLLLLGPGPEPADELDADGKRREPVGQGLVVLERQHRGRGEEADLLAVHHRLERGAHRHFRLAVPDVAAQQAVHRHRRLHVLADILDGPLLVRRELVLERVVELAVPVGVGAEREPRHRLAGRVQLQELLGHVAHRAADPGLGLGPRRPAEPVEGLPGPGVLLQQIDLLHRNEQLVLARVSQLHELVVLETDGNLLEPDEDPDPVVDVHDPVPRLQIAKIGEERLGGAGPALPHPAFLVEDVRLGEDLQAGFRQPEPAGELARRHQQRGPVRLVRVVDGDGGEVVVGEQLDDPLGPAGGPRDEERGVAPLAAPGDLGRPLADPPVHLDHRLAGHVADPGRRVLALAFPQLLEPRDRREPVVEDRPIDEQPGRREHRFAPRLRFGEAAGGLLGPRLDGGPGGLALRQVDPDAGHPPQIVAEPGGPVRLVGRAVLGRGFEDLPQREDLGLVEGPRRALRGRIEAPQRLEAVARELGPDGVLVPGRKEVDDAAAHAELAVPVHRIPGDEPRIGQHVAHVRRLQERARYQSGPRREQTVGGAHARQERRRRRHHHPDRTGGEPVEGPPPGGRDVEVGGEATIRIDLVGGERQDAVTKLVRRGGRQAAEEEAGVGHHLLDVAGAGDDDDYRRLGGGGGHRETLGGRRQSGQGPRRPPQPGADGGRSQGRLERERRAGHRRPSTRGRRPARRSPRTSRRSRPARVTSEAA